MSDAPPARTYGGESEKRKIKKSAKAKNTGYTDDRYPREAADVSWSTHVRRWAIALKDHMRKTPHNNNGRITGGRLEGGALLIIASIIVPRRRRC